MLHPSLHDYLSSRCSTEPWSIDLEVHNKELAIHCIDLLDNRLKENICGLTLPYPIENETLPEAVPYAYKFWITHICLIPHATDNNNIAGTRTVALTSSTQDGGIGNFEKP